jgi:hypothetical protein
LILLWEKSVDINVIEMWEKDSKSEMRRSMEEQKFDDGKCDGVEEVQSWRGMGELSSFRVRVQDHGSLAPFCQC